MYSRKVCRRSAARIFACTWTEAGTITLMRSSSSVAAGRAGRPRPFFGVLICIIYTFAQKWARSRRSCFTCYVPRETATSLPLLLPPDRGTPPRSLLRLLPPRAPRPCRGCRMRVLRRARSTRAAPASIDRWPRDPLRERCRDRGSALAVAARAPRRALPHGRPTRRRSAQRRTPFTCRAARARRCGLAHGCRSACARAPRELAMFHMLRSP
jgi:hypothetical protein